MATETIHNYNLERVYKIKYEREAFTPGRNAAGEQILVGKLNDVLIVAIFFSPEGRYLRYAFYPVLRVPDPTLPKSVGWQRGMIIREARQDCIRALGMTPCDIQIRHFAFPDWDIGIAECYNVDFPDFQRAQAQGVPLEEERLIKWQKEKHWVLHWKNEFEMSDDGEVLSS